MKIGPATKLYFVGKHFFLKRSLLLYSVIILKSSDHYDRHVAHSGLAGLGRRFRCYKKSRAARFRVSSRSITIIYRHIGTRVFIALRVCPSPTLQSVTHYNTTTTAASRPRRRTIADR